MTVNEAENFPNRKQRAAICYSQWNKYAKTHGKEVDEGPERA